MSSRFRVKVVRGETEFEAEGDKQFVLDMLERFERDAGVGPARAKQERKARAPAVPEKAMSAREFLQRVGAKRHADKVLCFGYYLEKYGGKPEFTAADINNLYYEAKLEMSNTSQAITNNIKRGFMMDTPGQKKKAGRKRFVLTQSGEDYVESRL